MQNIDKGVAQVCQSLFKTMDSAHIHRVAIGDFQTNSTKSMFERYIENEIVNHLVTKAYAKVQVIERRRLSEVLTEQKLGSTGLLEKDTRAVIGKILGAGAIVSGETIVTSKEVKVNVRLYAVDTGRIMAAPSFTFLRDETIDELMTEPVMGNKRKDLFQEYKSIRKHQNRSMQKIEYILVTVKEVKRVGEQIHITLKFASTRKKVGASVAIYAEGSDNIADFWKFFPRPKLAELSDEQGHSYRFKNSTMKYAKTMNDWTTIQPNSEQIIQFTFQKNRKFEFGKKLTLSLLIRTATMGKNGKPRLSSATLYLENLVAN
jgi:TolB-like protein